MKERCTVVGFLKNLRAAIFPVLMFVLTASAAWATPTVTAVDPPDGSTPPVSTTVSATFSEPMDSATITNGSFTVSRSVRIKAIAGGGYHTIVLKSDGTVAAWGNNNYGETTVPPGMSGVVAIAAGYGHSLALKNDGTVVAWGANDYGQATVPPGLSGVVAIAAEFDHSLALKNDGTVVAWGRNDSGQATVPPGLSGVVAISAGWFHSLALKNDGTVVAWGANDYGQATVPPDLSGVVSVSAGGYHSLALKNDGTVVAWGYNYHGQATVPPGLSGVVAIAAGYWNSLALKNDGTVVAWGANDYGQATVPPGLSGVVSISAGTDHYLALKNDGTVVAWGNNWYGQTTVPQGLSGVVAIAAEFDHSLALKNDGTVVAWGANNSGQATVPPGLSGVVSISAGRRHSLALKNDGTVVVWGDNNYGQATVPPGLSGVVAISGGSYHSLALKNDGTVVAWGVNPYGQATTIPPGLSGVVAIAAGFVHSLALKNDGTVVAWGRNDYGQATVPPGLSGVVSISAGGYHSLALKNDGTVVAWGAWGWNDYGQSTVPAGLSGVVAISAGYDYSLALKNDGTVVAWGNNDYGQSTVPTSPYETVIKGSVVYDQATNIAAFTPSAPLEPGFTYFGTVTTGARSAAGERFASDARWSFYPGQKHAAITLAGLSQPYDGMPKAAIATTDPPGLAVTITYNGSAAPPTAVGSYTVAATINDAVYRGSSNAILTITNPTYTIGVTVVGGNGSISCDSPVTKGGNSICRITPDANYHLAAFTDNGVDMLGSVAANSYSISNVIANHAVLGTFAINTYAITASAPGGNGSISCTTPVNYGSNAICTISPNPGYYAVALTDSDAIVMKDVTPLNINNSYTIPFVSANHAVTATFAPLTVAIGSPAGTLPIGKNLTITSSVGGINCQWTSALTPSGTCTSSPITYGTPLVLTATVPKGYNIASWGANCDTSTSTTCTINNLTAPRTFSVQTIACVFTINPPSVSIGENPYNGTVTVTPDNSACSWDATTTDSWITVNQSTTSGSGSVNYDVGLNTGKTPRIGQIAIADQIFRVRQSNKP